MLKPFTLGEQIRGGPLSSDVLDAMADAVLVLGPDRRIAIANAAAAVMFGYEREELIDEPLDKLLPVRCRESHAAHIGEFAAHPHERPMNGALDLRALHADGHEFPVDITLKPLTISGLACSMSVVRDITELRLASLVATTDDAIYSIDLEGIVDTWNRGAEALYGYTAGETIGSAFATHIPRNRWAEQVRIRRGILDGQVTHLETVRLHRDRLPVDVALTISPIRDASGVISGGSIVGRNIAAQKKINEEIEFLAYHDVLTGLPNRRLLIDRLDHAVAHVRRYGGALSLVSIDLDDFKSVNDRLGHDAGDAVLAAVSNRLLLCVRDSDTVARMGGDEFVLLLDEAERKHAQRVSRRVHASLAEPIDYRGHVVSPGVSAGIAVFGEDGGDAASLFRAADRRMYRAKKYRRQG